MKRHISNSLGCLALVISILWLCLPASGLGSTRVVAWGAGTNNTLYTPNYGQCIVPADLTNAIAIAAGFVHSVALTADGKVITWYSVDTNMPPTTNAVAIAAGYAAQHTLALQANGTVAVGGNACCGLSVMPANSNDAAVAGGWEFSLALRTDGTVICWGTNTFSGPWSNVVAVSAGNWGGLVLKADGTVTKWQAFGSVTEVAVPADLTNVVAIASGGYFQDLALKADGTVFAWSGTSGTYVPGLSNVVAIAAGENHNVALKADGTVVAWLINTFDDYGQATVPAGLSNVVAIAAGGYHTLALVGEGPPVLRAPMANPTVGAGGFGVSLPSQSGRVYALEFKNLLTDSNWTALPLAAGTGRWLRLADSTATKSQRFYRVRRW
jgi:alpha-tubulin suppressor-like RCC1 family protein